MRRTSYWLARRKHGQRAWSPNASSSGAAPSNGVTAQEALQIAYRPMPAQQTVEYEEDFGINMMIHREFISKKNRHQMTFDVSSLAYSDTELQRGRQQLATTMNRERGGALVGMAGESGDRVMFNADIDNESREVKSARYLFNESRMQFCERFQGYFHHMVEESHALRESGRPGRLPNALLDRLPTGEDSQMLFSLMEACAVLYGCDTDEARETYFRLFLRLDLDTLETEEEALRERLADMDAVTRALGVDDGATQPGSADGLSVDGAEQKTLSSEAMVSSMITAVPNLFGEDADTDSPRPVPVEDEAVNKGRAGDASAALVEGSPQGAPIPAHLDEYAPLYKAYLAHAEGGQPVASYDVSSLGATSALAERRRWRHVMEKVAREAYHQLTTDELHDALALNNQLHTVKFLDLKVGDTVREIMALLQQQTGSSSLHRDSPLEMSSAHPDRRV